MSPGAPDPALGRRLLLAFLASTLLHALLVGSLKPTANAPSVGFIAARLNAVMVPAETGASAREEPAPSGSSREAPGRAFPVRPRYYTAQEVDVRATPAKLTTRTRTEANLMLGRFVRVKLRLFISETGHVDRFDVLEAEGLADPATLNDIREVRFLPAQKDGLAVKSQKIIELSFLP